MEENKSIWNEDLQTLLTKFKQSLPMLGRAPLHAELSDLTENKIRDFLQKTEKAQFQVAFVGTIKAGKSTMINALLHGNYASTSVAPGTAVLTKFEDSGSEDYYIEVKVEIL